jgi:hypothetical protein
MNKRMFPGLRFYIVDTGAQQDAWDAKAAADSINYTFDTGPSPQPADGGAGANYRAEADQIAGKLGPAITVYEPERYARMLGEAD